MKAETAANTTAIERREFIATGLRLSAMSTATLSVVGASAGLVGCGGKTVQPASDYRYLRADDIALFTALCPVILAPQAQVEDFSNTVNAVIRRIDDLAFNLDAPNRKTVYQLFDLLNMRVTRWMATGISAPWQQATDSEIIEFLESWRDSSIELFNVGYRALTKFVAASYFSLPESRVHSGYPGPQAWALQATKLSKGQAAAQTSGNN